MSRSSLLLIFSSSVSRGRPLPRLLWLALATRVCTSLLPTLVFSPTAGTLDDLVCLWLAEEPGVEEVEVAIVVPPSAMCWLTTLSILICTEWNTLTIEHVNSTHNTEHCI